MSTIVDSVARGDLLLCNESFSSTNEREAATIGGDIVTGLLDCGVRVHLVTHYYEFADRLRAEAAGATFLRAVRLEDGTRSHQVIPGPPLRTSYGEDLYREVFSASLDANISPRPDRAHPSR